MSEVRGHFCPCCGVLQHPFLRYPWHLCNDCRKRAVDGAGRQLEFSNESVSGGFRFRYGGDDDGDWVSCRAVIALISGRPVRITEARFGGIVAEPIPDRPQPRDDKVHDLRRNPGASDGAALFSTGDFRRVIQGAPQGFSQKPWQAVLQTASRRAQPQVG